MNPLVGPVAFIDDELGDEASEAFKLLEEIRATGRPVVTSKGVPPELDAWIAHWQNLAFAVVDWDLTPNAAGSRGSMGSSGGATLSEFHRKELFAFLTKLMKHVYCPIFIVSAENTDDIQRQISENPEFLLSSGGLDGRITVLPKSAVLDHLDTKVSELISASPSLTALTAWAREHDAAKNRMFIELNSSVPDWPIYVWNAAEGEVDPAYELAAVISTNLLSRHNLVPFDVDVMTGPLGGLSGEGRRRVSQGRTWISNDKLSERMVLPGDIFKLPESDDNEKSDDNKIWINISPACRTVGREIRTDADGTIVRAPIQLHLLCGRQLKPPKSEGELKDMAKAVNSIVIHTLLGDSPFKFDFSVACMMSWEEIREKRIARLLPPFVTRLQQMHAAYIQSEGLPKVTIDLYR